MISPDSCLSLLRSRRSVRAYLPDPVDSGKISNCIEAARLAPSACNAQPWTFVVVDDPGLKEAVAVAASGGILPMNHFTRQAPVMIVVVRESANLTSKLGQIMKDKPYPLIDNGIAVAHFCIQASAEGLGTCIIGWFEEKKVKKLLGIPSDKRAELLITVGYAADNEKKHEKIRKPIESMSCRNHYY